MNAHINRLVWTDHDKTDITNLCGPLRALPVFTYTRPSQLSEVVQAARVRRMGQEDVARTVRRMGQEDVARTGRAKDVTVNFRQ